MCVNNSVDGCCYVCPAASSLIATVRPRLALLQLPLRREILTLPRPRVPRVPRVRMAQRCRRLTRASTRAAPLRRGCRRFKIRTQRTRLVCRALERCLLTSLIFFTVHCSFTNSILHNPALLLFFRPPNSINTTQILKSAIR